MLGCARSSVTAQPRKQRTRQPNLHIERLKALVAAASCFPPVISCYLKETNGAKRVRDRARFLFASCTLQAKARRRVVPALLFSPVIYRNDGHRRTRGREPPHPEEAATAPSRRMGGAPCLSCFETPRHSAWKTRVNALEARLLSMRAAATGAILGMRSPAN